MCMKVTKITDNPPCEPIFKNIPSNKLLNTPIISQSLICKDSFTLNQRKYSIQDIVSSYFGWEIIINYNNATDDHIAM